MKMGNIQSSHGKTGKKVAFCATDEPVGRLGA